MKVLHVINSLQVGGAEKLVTSTAPLYNAKGVDTDLLVLNGSPTPFTEQLKAQGCTVYDLGRGSVYNPLLSFKIIKYLKKYDIVHVHLFPAQYWVALAKRLSFSGVKLVYTEHSTSSRRTRKPFFKIIDPFFYAPYVKIIGIAYDVIKTINSHVNIAPKKLALIKNGVDILKFSEADPLDKAEIFMEDSAKIIIQVSSFQYPKDQATVIRALLHLPQNVRLLLVGDGKLLGECKSLVANLGLTDRVKFLGIRMDVARLLKTADVIVLSSRYEGLSLSSIEGMASGRPFVASNVPGLKDIVGGAGVLFPVGDEKQLAAVISRLITDGAFYKEVALKGVARAAEYDINIMIDKHIMLYKSLL